MYGLMSNIDDPVVPKRFAITPPIKRSTTFFKGVDFPLIFMNIPPETTYKQNNNVIKTEIFF